MTGSNMDRLSAYYDKLDGQEKENRGYSQSDVTYLDMPKAGKKEETKPIRIRILPQPTGIFFSHVFIHYNLDGKKVRCARSFGQPCQICEIATKLKEISRDTAQSAEVQEAAKALHGGEGTGIKASSKHFAAVVDRRDKGAMIQDEETGEERQEFPDGRVKIWSFSEGFRKQIQKIMCPPVSVDSDDDDSEGAIDITDMQAGYDVNVRSYYEGGKKYANPEVDLPKARKPSAAFPSGVAQEIPDVGPFVGKFREDQYTAALQWLQEHVREMLSEHVAGGIELGEDGTLEEPAAPAPAAKPVAAKASTKAAPTSKTAKKQDSPAEVRALLEDSSTPAAAVAEAETADEDDDLPF